jgi:hypothetical protein
MYGLPRPGLFANKLLAHHLAKYGYYPAVHTPGLWKHTWHPNQFVLVVNAFKIEYKDKQHAKHLIDAHSKPTTKLSLKTGKVHYFVGSNLAEITAYKQLICPCLLKVE